MIRHVTAAVLTMAASGSLGVLTACFVSDRHYVGLDAADGPPGDGSACEPLVAWQRTAGALNELWVSRPDATNQRPISTTKAGAPAWSPMGDRITFSASNGPTAEVWTIGLDGIPAIPLTDGGGSGPAWSPDGSQIAFVRSQGIWIVSSAGGVPTQLTDTQTTTADLFSWSPDGQRIAFTTARDGDREVYVMSSLGDDETNCTMSPSSDDYGPRWSPGGTHIVFESNRSGRIDLWRVDADCQNPINLAASTSTQGIRDYQWFPDGSKIVYNREAAGPPVVGDIYVMNADGTGQQPFDQEPGWDLSPEVSPDGSAITWVRAFDDSGDTNTEVFAKNVDGTNPIRITNSSAIDAGPTRRPCR